MSSRSLTQKQETFARAFVANGGNASRAYREAYAVDRMSDNAVDVEAHRLRHHPKVALRISALQQEFLARYGVDADRLLGTLAAIAFTHLTDIITWNSHGVKVKPVELLTQQERRAIRYIRRHVSATRADGRVVEWWDVQMHSPLKALRLLGRYLGMWNGEAAQRQAEEERRREAEMYAQFFASMPAEERKAWLEEINDRIIGGKRDPPA